MLNKAEIAILITAIAMVNWFFSAGKEAEDISSKKLNVSVTKSTERHPERTKLAPTSVHNNPIRREKKSEDVADKRPSHAEFMSDIKPILMIHDNESEVDFLLRLLDLTQDDLDGVALYTISDLLLPCSGIEYNTESFLERENDLVGKGLGYDASIDVASGEQEMISKCEEFSSYANGRSWIDFARMSEEKGNPAAKLALIETPHPSYFDLDDREMNDH